MSILIQNVTAVLLDESRTVLPNAFVAVEGSQISYVGTKRPAGPFDQVIDGAGKVLMPGFVNAHTHVPMTLMRGYGGGCDLHTWLHQYIFPTEAKWDDRAIRAATALGLAEMIASGVTCIADMYMNNEAIIQEVLSAGISANICCGATQFTDGFYPETHHDCVVQRQLTERWHGAGEGQIAIDGSIHGEYTSHAPLWEWMALYAADHGLGMHVHLSETKSEHDGCVARHGRTPAALFEQYGVFAVRAIAAHCVWTTPDDWAILARNGVSAVTNPMSNLKLGSGIAPLKGLRQAGVNVALGTDGVSSNNSTDLFADMKLAAILTCGAEHDPMAVTAWDALETATVNGARALGRKAGRVAPGYTADLILVDFDRPNLIPCHDTVENLVYAAHGADVCMNMARGRVIYQNGAFLTIDLDRVKREIRDYALPLLFG